MTIPESHKRIADYGWSSVFIIAILCIGLVLSVKLEANLVSSPVAYCSNLTQGQTIWADNLTMNYSQCQSFIAEMRNFTYMKGKT